MRKTFAGVGAWRILQGGADMLNQVIHGDCLEVLRTMPDNSVDAVVIDPPYGLSRTRGFGLDDVYEEVK